MTLPRLVWDIGTAYDLFISLEVLHKPEEFGVRASWAAGVRARLSAAEREILEWSQLLCPLPLPWIYKLPAPKDAITVLWALGRVPARARLPLLALGPAVPADAEAVLRGIAARGRWDEQDLGILLPVYRQREGESHSSEEVADLLGWWARAEEFGERYLEALRTYHQVFFAEEEARLRPALQQALNRAQDLAERLPLEDMLEELSQIRLDALPPVARWVAVPSYWNRPRTILTQIDPRCGMWLFDARPADVSLVPGEVVPDPMLQALKAFSDPTRLRILQYLAGEPLSSAEMARRLRLRAQTVAHHLTVLRQAGVVRTVEGSSGAEKCYVTDLEVIADIFASFQAFLEQGKEQRTE
jgi:DNA-binding transcriptional ArsR family regulator